MNRHMDPWDKKHRRVMRNLRIFRWTWKIMYGTAGIVMAYLYFTGHFLASP